MERQDNTDPVIAQRRGHVLLITINRPEVHNAVDRALAAQIGGMFEAADVDRDVRAVVLTGAGTRAFCAGSDLRAVSGSAMASPDATSPQWGFAGVANHPISKPFIAAVNGLCLGGGTELVLAADLAFASETATFGMPEVNVGVTFTGARRMTRQLPKKAAMNLLLTGSPITAVHAATICLVNEVVPPSELLAKALECADLISTRAPLAVQANKRLALGIEDGRIVEDDASVEHGQREAQALLGTRDAQEGVAAFLEKRLPRWESR